MFDLSQVQWRSGVWHRRHVGFGGAADTDAAADVGSDDHKQPQNGSSAGTAGGGMYTHTHTHAEDYLNYCGSRSEPGEKSTGFYVDAELFISFSSLFFF